MSEETNAGQRPGALGRTDRPEAGPTPNGTLLDSMIGGVSVRALIAILIVSSVCAVYVASIAVDLYVSFVMKVAPTFAVPDPIYGGFLLILGAYIGKPREK